MNSLVVYTLLASATLSAAVDPRFEFPDTVPLVKRQQPGTPQDTGLLITLAREEKDFCGSQEWKEHYDDCMKCANTYGIWKYYGEGVSKIAEQCDLSPTPSPSGAAVEETVVSSVGESGTTTIKESATEEVVTEAASTIIQTQSAIMTSQPVVTTNELSEHQHTSADVIGTPEVTATQTPEPSTVVVSGAAKHFEFVTAGIFVAFAIYNVY
ncbi:hypothetical protein FLONG3_6048 [Fusarium longipes]|uniref:Uncharacterized protein n=1 Tax=Fusarium longipes TaxID=694270 RepID=A0A395SQW3_9HYPO|nr:hypothetical protein FLONG3_6048 [Fusarium longipes]